MSLLLGSLAGLVFLLSVFAWTVGFRSAVWWAGLLVGAWLFGFLDPQWFPVGNTLGLIFGLTMLDIQRRVSYGVTVTVLFGAAIGLDLGYSYGIAGNGQGYFWALVLAYLGQLFAVGMVCVTHILARAFATPSKRSLKMFDDLQRVWVRA